MTRRKEGLNRRELLKAGLVAGGAVVLGSKGLAPSAARAGENFSTSPMILSPFTDLCPIPSTAPLAPSDPTTWTKPNGQLMPPDPHYNGRAPHQIWQKPGPGCYYSIPILFRPHSFTSSLVQGPNGVRSLPDTWMSLFNGTFPGPLIHANYGQPTMVRFRNLLNPDDGPGEWGDFGVMSSMTHLHNGHTAPESDGNPFYTMGDGYDSWYMGGNGRWFYDNLYLQMPPDNDTRERQSFFWFHDHRMGDTSTNVQKGMVGMYYLHDELDGNDETKGYRLPSGEYDIPLALYDLRLDDGVTPHTGQDSDNNAYFGGFGTHQDGQPHPERWGKLFFGHYPNQGFVGDVMTVNGKVLPYLPVKRRKYRIRFLDCSISRQYELALMAGTPTAAPTVQGQYVLAGAHQVMKWVHIASDGGLVPRPFLRDTFQIWPAKRKEFIVDFSKYQDGTPTHAGDKIYLTNTLSMTTGRKADDPVGIGPYVPLLQFVIDGTPVVDNSLIPSKLRTLPPRPTDAQLAGLTHRSFTLSRGGGSGGNQWEINGQPFDPMVSLADVPRGSPEVWHIINGGGGWTHPLHLHMEEHQVITRNGLQPPPEDVSREDVVALKEGEDVAIYRRFRTFLGGYVTHCHNLAHEDHAMMFGWNIV